MDLVLLHSQDFRFYGKRAGLIAAVNGVLDMMRVDARAMRIRTFCQPDTVIAKQLLDAQSLFNLIGCYEQQQIQLAEVIQFFKVRNTIPFYPSPIRASSLHRIGPTNPFPPR